MIAEGAPFLYKYPMRSSTIRYALLPLAWCAMLPVTPAAAEAPQVQPAWDGYFRDGRWTAVTVTVPRSQPPYHVRVTVRIGSVRFTTAPARLDTVRAFTIPILPRAEEEIKIELENLDTGHIDVLEQLEKKLPKGLPALLEIPGMGPKKVALAHEKLNVGSVADLQRVIESGALAELPGLGAASAKKIAEGIAHRNAVRLFGAGKDTGLPE